MSRIVLTLADQINYQGRGCCAGEGEYWPAEYQPGSKHDREYRTQRCASGDPEYIWVCQRISQQCLEGRARHCKGSPDGHCERNSRQAQTEDDDLLLRRQPDCHPGQFGPDRTENSIERNMLASNCESE